MLGVVGLAVVLFASTNADDFLMLLGFAADPRVRVTHLLVGQYLGLGFLVGISLLGRLASMALTTPEVGLFGLLPILIGIDKLVALWRGRRLDGSASHGPGVGRVLSIAGVTIANGGDNVAVYVPVLATRTGTDIAVMAAVFTGLIAAWVGMAVWLVRHPTLGAPIRRYGAVVTPFVLIAIGLHVLDEAGSLHLLAGTWS